MARTRSTSAARRSSGPTQPEDDRKAKAVLLRLLPAAEQELRRRAKASGVSLSAVVTALLDVERKAPVRDSAESILAGTLVKCERCEGSFWLSAPALVVQAKKA